MAAQLQLWRGGAFSVVFLLFIIATTDAQICSPHGSEAPGECMPARNCPRLLNAFQALDLANFIEQHGCGVEPETGDVLVCCPRIIAVSGGIHHGPPRPSQNCGSKQVNGGALWPFVVGLGYVVPGNDLIAVTCNGVLISPQWVLTDPSCFSQHVITTAFFGIGRAEYDKVTRVTVAQTIRPTDYDSARDQNAIGLVKLSAPVTASDDIQVACMPPDADYDPASPRFVLYIGKIDDGSVAGGFEVRSFWKHKVSLEQCRTSPGIAVFPTLAHLCTNGLQACNIPMARPLLVGLDPDEGGYTILGVGGLTADRCTSDVTSYTAVSKYLPYINRMVNPATTVDQLFVTASELLQTLVGREDVETCGRRIIGAGLQFPFIVSLGKRSPSSGGEGSRTYTSFCTGVLLTTTWVLTDARCLNNNAVDHAATAYSRGAANTKYSKVASFMTPPGYSLEHDHNTVALINLETPLDFTVDTQPICLSRPSSYDNSSSLTALSAGYGFNQAGELKLDTGLQPVGRQTNDACIASRYVTFDAQPGPYICTSNIEACKFLANPPIIAEEDVNSKTFTIVGVGGDNANYCKGDFMAHVRVRPHVPWITSIVFPNGDPNNPDVSDLLSSFTNNFQPNAPPQNTPPNQSEGAPSQLRVNKPQGTVSPAATGNVVPHPVSQAASLNNRPQGTVSPAATGNVVPHPVSQAASLNDNKPQGTVSPAATGNVVHHPVSQAASLNSGGAPAFTTGSTPRISPNRSIVFPN